MDTDIDLHLGKRLRSRRLFLGLTQQQLADLVCIRFQQIQKYECAANRVSAARLWQLAVALEVPVDYFFSGLPKSAGRENAPRRNGADGRSGDDPELGLLNA